MEIFLQIFFENGQIFVSALVEMPLGQGGNGYIFTCEEQVLGCRCVVGRCTGIQHTQVVEPRGISFNLLYCSLAISLASLAFEQGYAYFGTAVGGRVVGEVNEPHCLFGFAVGYYEPHFAGNHYLLRLPGEVLFNCIS